MDKIFISIASYRDPDLINTINSLYNNAENKNNLFFSIVEYESNKNFIDISFIPKNQYSHQKIDYRLADGTCNSRHLANSILNKQYEYFLQIDSHTRVAKNWDSQIISEYKRCSQKWGNNYVFSRYASSFIIDKNGNEFIFPTATFENYEDIPQNVDIRFSKLIPIWDEQECIWRSCGEPMYNQEWGEQSYSISAHLIFCKSETMINVPYDPYLYFLGEEITLAIRFYINDIKVVSLPIDVLYHNYDRSNYKRDYHWTDNENWKIRDKFSRQRLSDFFYCKNLGPYGILDIEKYKRFQIEANVNFENKIYIKPEYLMETSSRND